MRKIELLSPAGNFDCLKAAINNGADAVYLGGKNFSARAFANNFSSEELEEAVKYAHLRNVRIFVTLNTLLNEKEFANAIKMADYYYRINVDALLIQDLGLYYVLKEKYPDFELHCSTQMHVHNLEGVRTAKKLGFKRVVIARESDLDFIKRACKEDIEVEVFVHGAICVSYSGQCLMSSSTKNRSANKGMCAQCCRLRYELYDDHDSKIKTDTDYLLSPKDMYLLNDIPTLIDAGVSSFKIEGRMKSSAYVGYVTSLYRKAIDQYLDGKKYTATDEEMDNLRVLFNRNFTNDLLYGKNDLFNQKSPNHLGIEIGEVTSNHNGKTYIHLIRDLHQFDGIRINDFGCNVNMLYKNDLLVSEGKAGETVAIETDENLKGKVYKTQDYLLEKEINTRDDKKLPLDISVSVHPDLNVSVTLYSSDVSFVYKSDIIAQKALKAPLNEDSIIKQFSKLNDTIYYLNNMSVDTDNAFLPVKDLNEIRRNAIEKFNEYRLSQFRRFPLYPEYEFKQIKYDDTDHEMKQIDDQIFLDDKIFDLNYVINKESVYSDNERAAISEFGGLLKPYKEKIAYYTLNCVNSYCYEFLKKIGFDYIILSSELQENEINDLIEAYSQRNKHTIKPYVFAYGDRVLMYIRTNPFDKYMVENKQYYLKDGKYLYRIRHNHRITELIEEEKVFKSPENKPFLPFSVTYTKDN
ncbi:MAG: U32 family peptidase [Erysipelotrichaceae bacterium]|nr:U32 family peptidase [Erysipelotrichaceae bacterium]